jgi:peroxiredoxin (alkyl hydroperoxide reductase subunit C)
MIEPGAPAPDFALPDQDGNIVKLEDLRGQTTVLVFYPLDFSPVCTDQLNVYQEVVADIEAEGAKLYGISVDSAFAHKAFQAQLGTTIPLLADFHPKGEVSKAYGAYNEEYGNGLRALVMVGPDLVVQWSYVSPSPLEIPGANLIFDALGDRPGAPRVRLPDAGA